MAETLPPPITKKPRERKATRGPKPPPADLTIGPPPAPEVENAGEPGRGNGPLEPEFLNAPEVDETVVRTMLRSLAGVASFTVGRDDVKDHWVFTERELDDLTPPLTRYINRRPAVRAAVARGDEAAIGLVLASYTGRNVAAGRKAKNEQEKQKRAEQQREADAASRTDRASTTGRTPDAGGVYGGNGVVVPPASN